jgi:signal transduction histidine kinase
VRRPSASLRKVVATVVAVVGALALITSLALVVTTRELRHGSEELREAIESVRHGDGAAIHLLVHARVEDPVGRRDAERELREDLERAGDHVTSPEERELLRVAREKVEAYLATRGEGPDAGRAFYEASAAIDAVVSMNVRQAQAAVARARRMDRLGDVLGIGAAVLLLGAAGWLMWWLRARAFAPVLALAGAMQRFGSGDASARAPEAGPGELRDMARQFNEMAAALEAHRNRQLTFYAALAHELRTPLSALRLATARRRADGAEEDGTLALVRRQVERLERLVTDFLDTARIEAGQLDVRRREVDLRPIVEHVVSLFGAASQAHRFSVAVPSQELVASCDPGRVEQVLSNLVSNAIKYSPDGGEISVRLEARPGAVAVSVADQGVGIPEAECEAVFEPFRRGRARRDDVPGAGLGLFVSRRIVEAHGGRLRLTSAPGRGSTFEVLLPR